MRHGARRSGVVVRQRLALRSGVSTPFVHPALKAPDAPINWLPTAQVPHLDARSELSLKADSASFDPFTHPHVSHVILSPRNREDIILCGPKAGLTLTLKGTRSLIAPVQVQIPIDVQNPAPAADTLQHLTTLSLATGGEIVTKRLRKSLSRCRLLRDGLAAIDGDANGASYREIAAVLYGKAAADAAWSSHSRAMKDHIRYALSKGTALRDGGYRTLLSEGV